MSQQRSPGAEGNETQKLRCSGAQEPWSLVTSRTRGGSPDRGQEAKSPNPQPSSLHHQTPKPLNHTASPEAPGPFAFIADALIGLRGRRAEGALAAVPTGTG
mmetsp:Transcript_31406/g.49164  ORF Transcript_31406/g.49164 Transcript_31406/m.49164 type:complete len:102 (+) Transcript_31406:1317-1622(+)